MSFDFDPDEFARQAVNDVAREFQATMDRLLATHEGMAVEQVRAALRSALRGIDADADQIQEWSEAISSGTRIVAEVGR
jgi:hypothetical protein